MLEAAKRYAERQARQHWRLSRALRPYGDESTSVGDAFRCAAADLGIEADGRGFEALAEVVIVAAEARGGAPAANNVRHSNVDSARDGISQPDGVLIE